MEVIFKHKKDFHMVISYKKLQKHQVIFNRLFGMKVKNFDLLVEKAEIEWEESLKRSYKRPGKNHDFKIHKKSDPLPINTRVLGDSGYQGLRKLCKNAKTPIKKTRKKPLTEKQKLYNKAISKIRVKIENIFAQIKNFRILSDRYRNKRQGHNLKFNIVAGITNIKNGFMSKALMAA